MIGMKICFVNHTGLMLILAFFMKLAGGMFLLFYYLVVVSIIFLLYQWVNLKSIKNFFTQGVEKIGNK